MAQNLLLGRYKQSSRGAQKSDRALPCDTSVAVLTKAQRSQLAGCLHPRIQISKSVLGDKPKALKSAYLLHQRQTLE